MILTDLRHSWDERVQKTGKEWMVLLLRLRRETNEGMIEAVKEFWKKCSVLNVRMISVQPTVLFFACHLSFCPLQEPIQRPGSGAILIHL